MQNKEQGVKNKEVKQYCNPVVIAAGFIFLPPSMRIKTTIAVLFLLLGYYGHTQLNFEYIAGKFFLKGRVIDMQTKEPIPQANVRINGSSRGATCDDDGYFSLVVSKRDTLQFTTTGYMAKVIAVANIDSTQYHTLQVELLRDFIRLKEIVIYPFNGIDEFKQAFMEAKHVGKLILPGVPEPTFTGDAKPKLYNPITYLYEKIRRKRAADPNFKP